jgi:omega-6 fatty acid desaturase (delta-12 desaturase)
MTPQQYRELRQKMAKDGLFTAHDATGLAMVVGEFSLFFGGLYWLSLLQPWSIGFIALQIALGTSVFRLFVLMHDCGHHSLFRTRWLNNLFGLLTSIPGLMPLEGWRENHYKHHRWVGIRDKDPSASGLVSFEQKKQYSRLYVTVLRVVWVLRLPVPALAFMVNSLWFCPFRLVGEGRYKRAAKVAFSCLVAGAPHAVAVAWFGWSNYLTYFGPIFLAWLLWYEVINLTHHSGLYPLDSKQHPEPLALHEQQTVSRSTYLPKWLSTVLCYHFTLHAEHHLFPTIPWHHLPTVRKALAEIQVHDYLDVPFIKFNIALRKEDPVKVLLSQMSPAIERLQKPLLRP